MTTPANVDMIKAILDGATAQFKLWLGVTADGGQWVDYQDSKQAIWNLLHDVPNIRLKPTNPVVYRPIYGFSDKTVVAPVTSIASIPITAVASEKITYDVTTGAVLKVELV